MLESELEGDSDSPTRRSSKDSMAYLAIPTNSSLAGDGGVRCATRWPTVSAALRRPDESAVEELRMRYSRASGSPLISYVMMLAKEKVRWRKSFQDGQGPRKVSCCSGY